MIGLLWIRLNSTTFIPGRYWNKLSAPQRTILEWKEHVEEHNIKDLSRKYRGDYYDYFPSILKPTAQRTFVLHGGVWERAKVIRLFCLWFTTSHKASPLPLAFFFLFLLSMENPYPYFNVMVPGYVSCDQQWPRRYIFFGLLSWPMTRYWSCFWKV